MAEEGSRGWERRAANMARMTQPLDEQEHWCFPLTDPAWVAAGDATHMREDDPVLGLERDGRSWALPWWIMKNHHIANVVLDERPMLVTLCEVCTTAAAFDPVIEGKRRFFRLGGLYNGTIMPVDDETESLWTGFTGEAIDGPLRGHRLERLPLLQCTWQEWIAMHPDTLVPDGAGESREGHGEGRSPGSPQVDAAMSSLLKHVDGRMPHYTLVLGVTTGGHSRCYPLESLARHGLVLNDQLGETPIVVFSRPGTWMACAFGREVDGRTLDFATQGEDVVDRQTGSRWTISGKAIAGPLAGAQLPFVNSGIEEFFLWASFHQDTEVYQPPGAPPLAPSGTSSLFTIPPLVTQIIRNGWWQRDIEVLDAGCGDGLSSAWLAELGMRVTGVDTDAVAIERARSTFRGVVRLGFEVADLRRESPWEGRFDGIFDHGTLQGLAPQERAGYARNLGRASRPRARLLLLVACPEKMMKQRMDDIRSLFSADFNFIDGRKARLTSPGREGIRPGMALRMERRQ